MKRIYFRFSILACFIILLGATSCTETDSNQASKEKTSEFQSVLAIPDSLLTEEQEALKRQIADVLYNYTEVRNLNTENEQLVFTLSRADFLKMKLPEEYYDMMVKGINAINMYKNFNLSEGQPSLGTQFLDAKRSYLKDPKLQK